MAQVGGNGPLLQDGALESAAFNRPQGLALDPARKALYVADTENHAVRCVTRTCSPSHFTNCTFTNCAQVRKVDLASGTVTTLAGTGFKGQGDYRGGRAGRAQPLNSPWDLALAPGGNALYVAIAGQHQLWTVCGDGTFVSRTAPHAVVGVLAAFHVS